MELAPLLAPVLVALLSGAGTAYLLRDKTKADSYNAKASGDKSYAEIAQEAWNEVDATKRRLRMHDRRWRLVVPLLEQCAEQDPVAAQRLDELRLLNNLSDIDNANEGRLELPA